MSTEHEVELLHLAPWSEVIGTYHGFYVDVGHICVRVGKRVVAFPDGTREAALVRKTLNERMVGRKVGILRTEDLPDRPVLIRVVIEALYQAGNRSKRG